MAEQSNLVEALEQQAIERPRRVAFTLAEDPERRHESLDYATLYEGARRVATALRSRGLRRGDRVIVCLPTSLDLVTILYGVLAAGGVVVPVYPPFASRTLGAWKSRVAATARIVQPAGAVVSDDIRLHARSLMAAQGAGLFTVTPSSLLKTRGPLDDVVQVVPEDLALIQMTSGTTRRPRGVAITHANLMANIGAQIEAMGLDAATVSVSWLPPYHDMGLIGHIFTPLCCAAHQVLMSPRSFRERPVRWLQLITKYRATQTTAPNAAYEICARRVTAEERAALDLSSLEWALDGAEQVHVETIERFCAAFEPCGFRRAALRPVYGMAEATLAATFGAPDGARVDWVQRASLARSGDASPAAPEVEDRLAFVSVGAAIPGHDLRVVDESGRPLGPRQVGEICFRGPSVMQGYFNDPVATAEVLTDDGWLRTGDLGYVVEDGSVHITGRRREVIIRNGRNYSPHDLESAVDVVPGLRTGRVVACGVPRPSKGTEEIVVVVEARRPNALSDDELRARVVAAIHDATGVRPDRVELVAPGALPKTTSGKLQRAAVRQALIEDRALAGERPPLGEVVAPGLQSIASLLEARLARALGWR